MGKKKKARQEPVRFDWKSYHRLWRTFGRHLLPYWRTMLLAGIGMVLTTVVELARPWPLKLILDHVILGRTLPESGRWLEIFGTGALDLLLPITLLIVVIAIAQASFSYMNKYLMMVVGERLTVDIRDRIFVHLQALSLDFHGKSRSGDLVLRLTSDIGKLKRLFIDLVQDLASHTLRVTGIVITMLWIDWRLCAVAVAIVPVLYGLTRFFSGNVKRYQKEQRDRESDVASIVQENMLSISLIQAYTAEAKEQERFRRENNSSLVAQIRTAKLSKSYKRAVQVLIASGTAAVAYMGARQVLGAAMSPGDLVVFMAYLKELYGPIDKFSDMFVEMAQHVVSGERLAELVEEPVVICDSQTAVKAPRFRGEVQFVDVDFSYRHGKSVLQNLDLHVLPGQSVALVGSSGAGKSTLAKLLLRFYDPRAGHILIDGNDIRSYTLASLREQITVLLQDTFLFRKSVRDNLAFGRPDASEEEILAAARAAQAHDFIMKLPQKYDTLIEEAGTNFSGGQKQRLNIARAILRDAPILILDEPTTGLDAIAEAEINAALRRLTAGRTTFIMAHRFSTILEADHIVLLEHGKILQQGTHEQLLEESDKYRSLWELQSGGRRPDQVA